MRFTMEFLTGDYYEEYNDVSFEGIDLGMNWNGWACPAFNKEVADEIAKTINMHSEDFGFMGFFDSNDGGYFSVFEGNEEVERFSAMVVDGNLYYPIGAGSWIWMALE